MPVLFGPVSYNCNDADTFSKVKHTPYFTKPKNKMNDLEFRIVIPPTTKIKEEDIKPFCLYIPRPENLMEKVMILTPEIIAKAKSKNQPDK